MTARWKLIEELDYNEKLQEVGEALRNAVNDGHDEIFQTLVHRFPERLAPEEIDRLAASGDPELQVYAAVARLLNGGHEQAVSEIKRLFFMNDIEQSSQLTRFQVVQCVLSLLEAGLLKEASQLFKRLSRWRIESDDPGRMSALGELVASEQLSLPKVLPQQLGAAIARAARRGNLISATDEVLEYADLHEYQANWAAMLLADNDYPSLSFHKPQTRR